MRHHHRRGACAAANPVSHARESVHEPPPPARCPDGAGAPARARSARATQYGYSIYEFQVYAGSGRRRLVTADLANCPLTGYDVVERLGTHKSDTLTEAGQFWQNTPHETTILAISDENSPSAPPDHVRTRQISREAMPVAIAQYLRHAKVTSLRRLTGSFRRVMFRY